VADKKEGADRKKESPKKEAPKKAAPKKESPKKESPKKATPKKEAPKKESPKKESPKKESPKKEAPKKESSKKEAPKKEAPKKAAPKKETKAGKKPSKKKADKKRPAYEGPTSATKVNVYSLEGKKKGKINLPKAFDTEVRVDLIRNAVNRARANRRQPYGPGERAGMHHSVEQWGKGRGTARIMRIKGERRGAQSPGTVGGRKAHPPKVEKDWSQKMNRKEKHLARMSALSATAHKDMVEARGHMFDGELTLPIIVEEDFERLNEEHEEAFTQEMIEVLESLGVYDDVERAREGRHQRAGRGKMRGRRFKTPKSLLVVVEDVEAVRPFFRNLPGVDVVNPSLMSTERLAPGGDAGRLTIISMQALEQMMGWS
jgi:large subunit ribosomal protein L4e